MKHNDSAKMPQHIHNNGILEVNPERMKDIEQHVNAFDQKRIIANRNDYLTWMQQHFAPIVVPAHRRQEDEDEGK